jgi:hypothetical protein
MTTHFIAAEVELQESPVKTHQAVEAELRKRGEPLRWAITHVNRQKVRVEAVVITPELIESP